jgi:hypothetical protein
MKTTKGLGIGPSSIPNAGRGLFATRSFVRGEVITCYPGDGIVYTAPNVMMDDNDDDDDDEQVESVIWANPDATVESSPSRSQTNSWDLEEYTLRVNDKFSVIGVPSNNDNDDPHFYFYSGHYANDGACLVGGDAGMSTYVLESNALANAMHMNVDDCHMVTLATRSIAPGEEILVTYGPEYWYAYNQRHGLLLEDEDGDASRGSIRNASGKGFG